jgi:DNA-binding beta-propeller fold protein YncE
MVALSVLAGLLASGRNALFAATIHPGDLIVADSQNADFHGIIVDVNPVTGAQTLIASGGNLSQPEGVCLDASGNIIVADFGGMTTGKILKINPTTGAQTVISSGGSLLYPMSVAIDPGGELIVSQEDQSGAAGAVLKIDPTTGKQTVISSGNSLRVVTGLALAANGTEFVSEVQPNEVVAVDPKTGNQTVVSSGGIFNFGPWGMCMDDTRSQSLLVAEKDPTNASLVEVNTVTGQQTIVASGGNIFRPDDVTQDSMGDTYVTDLGSVSSPRGAVLDINLLTGGQSVISSGQMLLSPTAIAVVPEPASLAGIAMLGIACFLRRGRQGLAEGKRL